VILSTIPAKYDVATYLKMLKKDGDLVVLGYPPKRNMPSIDRSNLISSARRKIYGSQIGGSPARAAYKERHTLEDVAGRG
jgi:alcohol dehydrogenase (NADP+)